MRFSIGPTTSDGEKVIGGVLAAAAAATAAAANDAAAFEQCGLGIAIELLVLGNGDRLACNCDFDGKLLSRTLFL